MKLGEIKSAADFSLIAQEIFEKTTLLPYHPDRRHTKHDLHALPVERISHGTQHASRVAAYIVILVNFFKSLGYPKEIASLTQEQITLLQLTALFHDAARESDGVDKWEEKSAALFEAFLKENELYTEENKIFVEYITRTRNDYLNKLLQSADALDIMRVERSLRLDKVSLYNELKSGDKKLFVDLATEIRGLIAKQHDLKLPCSIKYHDEVIVQAIEATRNPFKPELKQAYEQAENCYLKTTSDFESFPLLRNYYNNNLSIGIPDKIDEVTVSSVDNLSPMNTAKMYLSFDAKWYYFCFASQEEAESSLSNVKSLINRDCPECKDAKVEAYSRIQSSTPYRYKLNKRQWQMLREKIRSQAPTLPITGDFLVKSLRADQFNYLRQFAEMTMRPFKHYPLRKGSKKKYIVTGRGIFTRKEFNEAAIPAKPSQYTAEEKFEFSKFQSTTLCCPDFYPPIFGFDKRKNKLVGVMVDIKDSLPSDHLYIYDGGTVYRPNYFYNLRKAKKYFSKNSNEILFHADQLELFKTAIKLKKNAGKYNEALMRIRFNPDGTSRLFVASDSLNARILALDYARVIKNHLLEHNQCEPDYHIDIVFYLPGTSSHMKIYSQEEQQMDICKANMIFHSDSLMEKKYKNDNYEFLLALSSGDILEALSKPYQRMPLALYIFSRGYVHILQSILETFNLELRDILPEKYFIDENKSSILKSLYYALSAKNFSFANHIIENFPLDSLDLPMKIEGSTLLHLTVENNLSEYFEMILRNMKDVNIMDTNGRTALIKAASSGYSDFVNTLLSHKSIDVNLTSNSHFTALTYACLYGYIDIVKSLLSCRKIYLDMQSTRGKTALMYAAKCGHKDVVNLLLKQKNITTNLKCNNGKTALIYAMENGYTDIAHMLLDKQKNIDVNDKCKKDKTLLMYAAEHGHKDIFYDLLRCKTIKVNNKCAEGKTALMYAVEQGNISLVCVLIENNDININEKCNRSKTALMYAVEQGHLHIIKVLLKHKNVYINQSGNQGKTALMYAIEKNDVNVVRALLKHSDIDVNRIYANGKTALMYAAEQGYTDIIKVLLQHKDINVNRIYANGKTALMYTAEKGDTDTTNALLQHEDIKVNEKCANGKTALMYAAEKGHTDTTNALLQHEDIKVNEKCANGKTALMYAIQNGHQDRDFIENESRNILYDIQEKIFQHHWELGLFGGCRVRRKNSQNKVENKTVSSTAKSILDILTKTNNGLSYYEAALLVKKDLEAARSCTHHGIFNKRKQSTSDQYAILSGTLNEIDNLLKRAGNKRN